MTPYEEIAALFKQHDQDFVRGGFGHISAKVVQEWDNNGELVWTPGADGKVVAAGQILEVKNKKKVEDFAGTVVAEIHPGDLHLKRVAFGVAHEEDGELVSGIDRRSFGKLLVHTGILAQESTTIWVEEFVEYRDVMDEAGLTEVCVKVRGDSTEIGVYALKPPTSKILCETKAVDVLTLEKLDLEVPVAQVTALVAAMKREGLEWADHYSHYNVAHTWKAITLKGYGGLADFIAKPSEMSKKWKEENPEKLNWTIQDTPIRKNFPEAEPLIDLVPGVKHRVRLMLLKAGSELLRHSDITDPDAGTADGKLLRIHIPLVTNPECFVNQWRLDGTLKSENLKVGEAWYLDTRKPHAVRNGGKSDRVHLVMDVESSPELRRLLGVTEDQKVKMEAWI